MIEAYTGDVSALAARILMGVGSQEDVEECVSDALVAAWNRAQEYDATRGTIRTWLLNLTKYKALDMRRKLMRYAQSDTEYGGTSSDPVLAQVLSREQQEDLVQCIERL